ncbi:NAD(P)-dependent oxidoreductase [Pseudaestuariivita sp.]|uniref:NAD(P)-dependent oxidoreductase n=1 Tax=Pseudaestuariivita sp. TaxID=2211669 RepID=UPI0040596ABE
MKPTVILDPGFRRMDELFSPDALAELQATYRLVGATDAGLSRSEIVDALPEAFAYIAAHPELSAEDLANAKNLKAVIEVSGSFRDAVDYDACFARGVEPLSCAPGFQDAVAEMVLGLLIASGRGIVAQHEKMRAGGGDWVDDCDATDFTLRGARIGFVGYGAIARATAKLLAPFGCEIIAHDPWLKEADIALLPLHDLIREARAVVIAASPTAENRHLVNADAIAQMPKGGVLIAISRAHLIDLEAARQAAEAGHIRFATDVFEPEPIPADHPLRSTPNVILSPHRAAAVPGGRHPIGDMILHDLKALSEGRPNRRLKRAEPHTIAALLDAPDVLAGQSKG